jgi:catechol 2,3-dioxygenase-like lactoylglutathione lyase family enzyme
MSSFIGVRHVGLASKNPAALATFYQDVMGMTVVGESPVDSPLGATLFLSAHPEEENHDIVFFSNQALAHMAFRVASLKELLTFYHQIKQQGLPIKFTFNHVASLAFYFEDPEGNLIEIYWATNVRGLRQPIAEPIDFDAPQEELLSEVERVAEQFRRADSPDADLRAHAATSKGRGSDTSAER